jgi:uncharacterized membrane protein YhaH (DUF805 family)
MSELRTMAFFGPGWIIAIAAIVLLTLKPKSRGRGLLIGALVLQLVLSVRSPLMFFLLAKEVITPGEYRAFFDSWMLFFNCLGTLGFILLLLYAYQLLDQVGSPLVRTLFSFKGRTGRLTFWTLFLASAALATPMYFHQWLVQTGQAKFFVPDIITYVLFLPVITVVSLATQVKRWHDRDKSGWLTLIAFVPFAGFIWIIVELGFFRGTKGSNRFGPEADQV